MKILYIDLDGVVADFDKFVQPYLPGVELGDGDSSDYADRSKMVDEVMANDPEIFEKLDLIEDAYESVMELSKHFEIYFLSTPVHKVPESYTGKRRWIRSNFGECADKRLILTHRKDLCIGDFLVDDRLKNGSENFKGEHIHFAQPGYENWKVVKELLLKKLEDAPNYLDELSRLVDLPHDADLKSEILKIANIIPIELKREFYKKIHNRFLNMLINEDEMWSKVKFVSREDTRKRIQKMYSIVRDVIETT